MAHCALSGAQEPGHETGDLFRVDHKEEQKVGVVKAKFWPQLYQHRLADLELFHLYL